MFPKYVWWMFSQTIGAMIFLELMLGSEMNNVDTLHSNYDFIIIGGGTAGSVLAGRLSEVPHWRVLLLEAGGEQTKKVRIPWFHLLMTNTPHDWKYVTEPNPNDALKGFKQRKSWWWRGKVIGGTNAINTMLYMRGNRLDYDHWAELGNEGWAFKDVLPYFKKLETMTNATMAKDDHFHGTHGPMVVEDARHSTILKEAFLSAGRDLGFSVRDQNAESQVGFAPFQFTIKEGIRWTTAQAYLKPDRPNLHIALNSHVHKILFNRGNRAIGVHVSRNGVLQKVYAKREVILAAGVVGSPHTLMLSGVGPKKVLQEAKVHPIINLPGVGENLQDHIAAYGLTWTTPAGVAYNPFLYTMDPRTYWNYKISRTGPLAAPIGVECNAFLPTKHALNASWPDLQITFVSSHPGFDGGTTYKDFLGIDDEAYSSYFGGNTFREGYSMYPIVNRPKSRGTIKLRSSDPNEPPIIQPNYLSDERDVKVLVEGLKISMLLGSGAEFRKLGSHFHSDAFPACAHHRHPNQLSDEYLECYVRHMATTDHHPVGSCKMGPASDPMAVVDARFRLRGAKRLRVVDASAMPVITSGNINIPITMMAERAADFIKEEYRAKKKQRWRRKKM